MTGTTTVTGVRFTVGKELTIAFADVAKDLVKGGPPDDQGLERLRSAALAGDGSVNDDERTFMGMLLDAANAAALNAQAFGNGASIEFATSTLTKSHRDWLANLDRPDISARIVGEETKAEEAAAHGRTEDARTHAALRDERAEKEILQLAGTTFAGTATTAITMAKGLNVTSANLLRAMNAGASDSTPGDPAFAGAVYVIALKAGSTMAPHVFAGHLQVDEVPHSTLGPDNWAAYKSTGAGEKGDTVYLPSDFALESLSHQAAVVHELHHAEEDAAVATSGTVQHLDRDAFELRAYRAQARFLLDSIGPLTGTARTTAVNQVARGPGWHQITAGAMGLEARASAATLNPILAEINNAAPATVQIPAADISAIQTIAPARLEAAVLALIRQGYRIAPGAKVNVDGLAGESILDWINRL